MDQSKARARALEDQLCAEMRDADGRVMLSRLEAQMLVTLADIGLIAVLALSDTKHAKAAAENLAKATEAWQDTHEDFIHAAAVCASVLQSERIAAFNVIRERNDG